MWSFGSQLFFSKFRIWFSLFQKQFNGGEGLFYLIGYSPSSREARAGACGRSHRRIMFTGCSQLHFELPFFPPALGWYCSVGWLLLYQLAIKKMPHRHVHMPIWWKQFLNWGSLFPGDFGLWQVDKPNQHTLGIWVGQNLCQVFG